MKQPVKEAVAEETAVKRCVPSPVVVVALAGLAAFAGPAWAWDDCRHEADREASVDLAGIDRVEVISRAGDLRLEAEEGSRAVATGRACASSKTLLEAIQIDTERSGSTLRIVAEMPETKGWNKVARLDLRVALPAETELHVKDGSGDVSARGVTLGRIQDGSGDLSLSGTFGEVSIDDGSGDIRISDHRGSVELEDGSGDAELTKISGSVRVREDGSGDLFMEDVEGSVEVERDGSGDVLVRRVGGDFIVGSAGSGDVRHRDVAGKVDVPTRD